jgi:Ca2+-binding EF-hand superfamily protein
LEVFFDALLYFAVKNTEEENSKINLSFHNCTIMFRLYDLNGDGVIQKDEMQDVALAVSYFFII